MSNANRCPKILYPTMVRVMEESLFQTGSPPKVSDLQRATPCPCLPCWDDVHYHVRELSCSQTEKWQNERSRNSASLGTVTVAHSTVKTILLASTPADCRRQSGRPRIMWLSTVQQDLRPHLVTFPEAVDMARNCPLWSMLLTYWIFEFHKVL